MLKLKLPPWGKSKLDHRPEGFSTPEAAYDLLGRYLPHSHTGRGDILIQVVKLSSESKTYKLGAIISDSYDEITRCAFYNHRELSLWITKATDLIVI